MAHHVVLIPGYLGFRGKEGYTGYWDSVAPILTECGFQCHPVPTEPIGPIKDRASRVRDAIVGLCETGAIGADDAIYLLGHSTGGLDARYLLSSGTRVALPSSIRRRVPAVATVATPHYGTPLADFFQTWHAEDLLGFVAGILAHWTTEQRLRHVAAFFHDRKNLIERLVPTPYRDEFARVLEGLALASSDEIVRLRGYLRSLATHRGALRQLRTIEMQRFNRVVPNAPDVRYYSYVTGREPPEQAGIAGAYYALLCFMSTRWPKGSLPALPSSVFVPPERVISPNGARQPMDASCVRLTPDLTDGLVPSVSQFWGEFGGYIPIDHRAAIGRFDFVPIPGFRERGLKSLYSRIASDLSNG